MTVCKRESISAIVTRRHRWAICRGSDWSRNSRFPYFWVFSSFGKKPSWTSAPSSMWLAISSRCRVVRVCRKAAGLLDSPLQEPCGSESARRFSSPNIEHPSLTRSSSSIATRFWLSILAISSGLYPTTSAHMDDTFVSRPRTFREIVFNLEILFLCRDGEVQSSDTVSLGLAHGASTVHGVLRGHCILARHGYE